MRERLLELLVCPSCGKQLTVNVALRKDVEIFEGTLSCHCDHVFPIIRGVPRLLPKDLQHQLTLLYPDFFRRYSSLLKWTDDQDHDFPSEKKAETIDRFGYEWTYFADYQCDNFSAFIASLPEGFFTGRLGLDMGCGAGRHAGQAAKMGAEVVAVDLSQSVDAAYQNNKENENVHVVQADIYNLPFRRNTFQFIYSLGVLQHLPDPERGYLTLTPFLKDGGALFIWVYAYALRKVALEFLRALSQRLSNDNIRRMAYLCNLLDYGIFVNLYRLLAHSAIFSRLAERWFPQRFKEYAAHGYRVAYADWFDRLSAPITNYYKKEELITWLTRSELHNTRILPVNDSWWWLYGEK
jgi:SAM-dependent methyltransferase/uncharacterized protein YbaR (Trm112 family)